MTVQQQEIDAVLEIFQAYGRPLGESGVLLATAVVTETNLARVRLVLEDMERRGLLRVKQPGDDNHDTSYELV